MDNDEKIAKLQKKLDKIDRKIHRSESGELGAAALLIDRRHTEELLWALGAEVREY
jgi:hypothetical protein